MENALPTPSPRRHAIWAGPLLAFAGLLSYFLFFFRWAVFRDFPWLNLMLLAGAVALSLLGLRHAWKQSLGQRVAAVAGLLLSSAMLGLLVFYCFFLSYSLPSQELAANVGSDLPPLVLSSHDGSPVDLRAAAAERVILVFYRGFW